MRTDLDRLLAFLRGAGFDETQRGRVPIAPGAFGRTSDGHPQHQTQISLLLRGGSSPDVVAFFEFDADGDLTLYGFTHSRS